MCVTPACDLLLCMTFEKINKLVIRVVLIFSP